MTPFEEKFMRSLIEELRGIRVELKRMNDLRVGQYMLKDPQFIQEEDFH